MQDDFASSFDFGRSGRMLEEMFRQSPAAMVLTDPTRPDNPIVGVNPAFEAMTGYPRSECVGRNCRFLQGEGTDRAEVRRLAECLAQEDECDFELLNYRKDGSPFWNRIHVGPIYDEDGALRYFFGTQSDVSERIASGHESLRLADRLGTALEASRAVGTFDWDVASDRLAVDANFARAFGLDPAVAAEGLPLEAFYRHVDDASREGLKAAVDEAVRTGEVFEHEYGVEGADRHRWLMGRGRCRHDADGQPTRFSGVVVDITRRKEAEDALRDALATAETAQREVDHRLKNLFALVPAIVNLSARRATDAADLAGRVQERVAALARAHSITLKAYSHAGGAELAPLVQAVLDPYTDHAEPFTLDGPTLRLSPGEAGAMALMLYELATNSAKHGALSQYGGTVRIAWSEDAADGRSGDASPGPLRVIWEEHGGPAIGAAPKHVGSGTDLVDRLARGFGGDVDREWNPEGLRVVLTIPLSHT